MSLVMIHAGLARASLMFSLLVGLISLGYYFLKRSIDGNLWGILVVGELLYLGQAAVGGILLATTSPLPENWRWVHLLYGVVLVISLPGAFAYSRGKDDRQAALAYGIVALFLAGVSIRAMLTAG